MYEKTKEAAWPRRFGEIIELGGASKKKPETGSYKDAEVDVVGALTNAGVSIVAFWGWEELARGWYRAGRKTIGCWFKGPLL